MAGFFDSLTLTEGQQFLQAFKDAGGNAELARRMINDPSLGRAMVDTGRNYKPSDRFVRYVPYLRTLEEQKQILYELDKQMPKKLRLPGGLFPGLNTSCHDQSVEDLEFFFVVRGTLRETLAYNWELIRLTQPSVRRANFVTDTENSRFCMKGRRYSPGIHRVRINLVANWSPKRGRSVLQVRKRTAGGVKLAGVEVLGALGLQDPRLMQSQDGKNLPYCDLAGLQLNNESMQSLRISRNRHHELCVQPFNSGRVLRGSSAPSLLE